MMRPARPAACLSSSACSSVSMAFMRPRLLVAQAGPSCRLQQQQWQQRQQQQRRGPGSSGGGGVVALASRNKDSQAEDRLEGELQQTQRRLDEFAQAIQAAQQLQEAGALRDGGAAAAAPAPGGDHLQAREQQLWDRQQALLDRQQQLWDADRAAWQERERALQAEVAALRQELRSLLLLLAGAADPAAPAARAARISGPSTASAAVATALRAVRDGEASDGEDDRSGGSGGSSSSATTKASAATTTATTSGGGSGAEKASGGSGWRDLFPGAAAAAEDGTDEGGLRADIAAAIAAVDDTDVLANLDLSYGGGGGRRRRRSSTTTAAEAPPETAAAAAVPAAAAAAAAPAAAAAVESVRGDPAGPPPLLSAGDDDIFWVAKLHEGLMASGFYPSDDEVENWLFAEGTQAALLTFQACEGLPESGVTCEATWRRLIGEERYESAYGHLLTSGGNGGGNGGGATSSSSSSSSVAAAGVAMDAAGDVVTFSFEASSSSSTTTTTATTSSSSSSGKGGGGGGGAGFSSWPVLMDTDGGREVHALQVALGRAGYFCGDDELRWWQFGAGTADALKTFQACSGLPESGVADERTWRALLGPDAAPKDLYEVRGEDSYDEDMSQMQEGRVWLLGEQRWSRPGGSDP